MKTLSLAALAAAALFATTPALADTYAFGFSSFNNQQNLVVDGSLLSTDYYQGWVSDNGSNTGGPDNNDNYVLGNFTIATGPVNARDYFVFDISDLNAPVSSASLSLQTYTVSGPITFRFGGASDLAPLLSNPTSPNPTLYTALGSGTEYGTYSLTDTDSNTIQSFALNAAGVSDLNARIAAGDRYFAVAGSLVTSGAVPEPATWAMMIGGVGIAGGMMRRGRRATLTTVRA